MTARSWQLLLLGGCSGSGKTTLGQELSARLGVPVIGVDDFRLVLLHATTPQSHPKLHFFNTSDQVWDEPPERQCHALIEVARVMSDALREVIAGRCLRSEPLIIEGDGLLPPLVADYASGLPETRGRVQAIYLDELDESILRQNMLQRGRGIQQHSEERRVRQARAAWLFGQWLSTEARRLGLPVLAARPYETLPDRVLADLA